MRDSVHRHQVQRDGHAAPGRQSQSPWIEGSSRAVVLDKDRIVFQLDTTLLTAAINPRTLALGPRTTLAQDVFPSVFGGAWAVSRDVLVYRPNDGGGRRMVWVSRDGRRESVAHNRGNTHFSEAVAGRQSRGGSHREEE